MKLTTIPKFYKSSGFSLIELMIVVSIIGMLAVMAMPSYKNYTLRARFSEVISATETFKTAISLALQENIPITELINGMHGIPPIPKATKHLASIKVEGGIITATGTELVNNATYILKPNEEGSAFTISGSCLKNNLCNA